ncbi:phosphohydrolase [Mucilaginibacter pallidiroseus]|uniref:Phosphohydrolase n=1 Tax=Mucilaginibacter pallidiroseus TaxID=2599295 RepID=A0A563UCW3_9SPHI|nr:Pycsar system effector family protein [Mucilaginibacter pallidiroseus]TWR29195.1 phosphohydrolase [Mucilaginibacter pallidiroseus]
MNYNQLLKQVKEYVNAYYKNHNDDRLVYHCKDHTEDVVKASVKIGNHYQLNDHDFFVVQAAAWFHDLGYMIDVNDHETESSKLAETFLKQHGVEEPVINDVKDCIMATRMPQQPKNLLQSILCDADLFHLGTDDFAKKDKRLFKEFKLLQSIDLTKNEWRRKSIQFLQSHRYHTDYCQVLLNSGKEANIKALQLKVDEKDAELEAEQKKDIKPIVKPVAAAANEDDDDEDDMPMPFSDSKKKKDRPDKGIETMFRISSSNHQRLSDMADNKAHIMITVNSIILSAVISLLLRKLTEYEYLAIPTFILLSISLLAMTFSILATRPSIPTGEFEKADIDEKKVNLLFFGNFYKMPLEDYAYGMVKMMEDKEFLYGSLIRDVYAQGVVLGKKYRLLRVAYNVFMFGLIASVIAFIVASVLYNSKGHK